MRILEPWCIEYGRFAGKWIVGVEESNGETSWFYLHSDGVIRESTRNRETGEYTGYFDSELLAETIKAQWEIEQEALVRIQW
jgi:hypothetical protein